MSKKKTILILSESFLENDPRIQRQITALQSTYNIITCGFSKSNRTGIKDFPLLKLNPSKNRLQHILRLFKLLTKQYESFYWHRYRKEAFSILLIKEFDLILCNDVGALPLAVKLKRNKKCPIYCDLHEYYPGQSSKRFYNVYNTYLCKTYFKDIDIASTVCPSIQALYKDKFQLDCDLVTNAKEKYETTIQKTNPTKIKMVHHGAGLPKRNLEAMIEMMEFMDERFELDFYLTQPYPQYIIKLKKMCDSRTRIMDPVSYLDIMLTVSKYDIGVFLLPPKNINYQYALPNKFFEYMQARLAIAIGPTPDMQALVEQYNCGVVSEDFSPESLAKIINSLSVSEIDNYKRGSDYAATIENAENNFEITRELVSKAFKSTC